jgi:hypothetical protein
MEPFINCSTPHFTEPRLQQIPTQLQLLVVHQSLQQLKNT